MTPIGDAARTIVAEYDYTDANGKLLYQVVRMHPKTFRQRTPEPSGGWKWGLNGRKATLYRIPDLLAAVACGDPVWIVEGEKDVHALEAAGQVATTNSGGAGKWRPEFARAFKGAQKVRIVRDRDEAGEKHALTVFESLEAVVGDLAIVEAPEGKDAGEYLAAGGSIEGFRRVWPIDPKSDPVLWKQEIIRQAWRARDAPMRAVANDTPVVHPPLYPSGLWGEPDVNQLEGVSVLVGAPSAGKSIASLGMGLESAEAGWDVLYVLAEMQGSLVLDLGRRRMEGRGIPDRFHLFEAFQGVTFDDLMDAIGSVLSERPMLTIVDSASSFCSQMGQTSEEDTYSVARSTDLVTWATNARRASDGQLAFALLMEANADGRARGRIADHRADNALAFSTSKEDGLLKDVSLVKSWWRKTGPVGTFVVEPAHWRLKRVE